MGWLWANYWRLLRPDGVIGHKTVKFTFIYSTIMFIVCLYVAALRFIYIGMFYMYIITQYVSHIAYLKFHINMFYINPSRLSMKHV